MKRGLARAAALLLALSATGARADAVRLAELKWVGDNGPCPYRGRVEGDGAREVEVRVATHADPLRYKSDLAFYRLSTLLGTDLVPATEARPVRLTELIASARGDAPALERVRWDAAVRNDGTVMVSAIDRVAGADLVTAVGGGEVDAWRGWVEGRTPIPAAERELAAGYVEMLVLDYLSGNLFRRTAVVLRARHVLRLVDNRGVFAEHPDPKALDVGLSELKKVTRFPRGFVDKLRALDRASVDAALHAGSYASWLVAARPLSELMERKQAILSLVDARIAEAGEAATLAMP